MSKYRQAPSIHKIEDFTNRSSSAHFAEAKINGRWYPARPLGLDTIGNRIRCAWIVFRGKGDVLVWPTEDKQ